MEEKKKKAVVLLSGGLDSATREEKEGSGIVERRTGFRDGFGDC